MIHDPRTLYRRFTLGAAGLTATAALLRTLGVTLFFDRTVGYIDANIFSTLLYISLPLFVLGCVAYASLAARGEKAALVAVAPDEFSTAPTVKYASLLVALTFIGATAAELLLYGFATSTSLVRYLGAIASVLYFALPRSRATAITGLGVHVYAILSLSQEYFDWSIPLNSPLKLMQHAAMLAVMLFILVEINHLNQSRRSIRYTVCAALALFCGVVNTLPLIAAALLGGIVQTDYLLRALPPMAIGLYAAARLFASHEIELPAPEQEPAEEQAVEDAVSEPIADGQDASTPTSKEEES